MQKRLYPILFAFIISSSFCFAQSQKDNTEKQIKALLKSYCRAVSSQNVDEVISYYWNSPDFLVYSNGKTTDYKATVAEVKGFLPFQKKVQASFDTLYIRRISPDAVMATGPFYETFTDKDGKEIALKADATWIIIRRGNSYKFAYVTASYQSLNSTK